jgi:group I intron endonuclease
MYTIYLWKANGIPKYVGSTKLKITKRIQQHYSDKRSAIYKYIREHPNEEFSYVTIDFANTKKEAFEKESFWTLFYRERYSMLNIYTGSTPDENTRKVRSEQNKGKHLSEETKEKIRIAKKGSRHPLYGKHHTEESKKKMSEAKKDKYHTEETKRKISEANKGKNNHFYGKHHTEATKKKMSEARKGKFVGGKSPNAKKVRIKETNQIFDTITECAKFFNISRPAISKAIKWKSKVKRKYTIEYI